MERGGTKTTLGSSFVTPHSFDIGLASFLSIVRVNITPPCSKSIQPSPAQAQPKARCQEFPTPLKNASAQPLTSLGVAIYDRYGKPTLANSERNDGSSPQRSFSFSPIMSAFFGK